MNVIGNEVFIPIDKVPQFIIDRLGDPVKVTTKNKGNNVENIATLFGFANYSHLDENEYLKEKDKIEFGNIKLDVLFLPGHSPGHLAFYFKNDNVCFSGDVLFYNSIGRTDLPGGDHDTLINSIKNKLFLLNPNTIIYPGHGQKTILKNEMKDNPFLI